MEAKIEYRKGNRPSVKAVKYSEHHESHEIRIETADHVVHITNQQDVRVFHKATGNMVSVVPEIGEPDFNPADGFNVHVGSGWRGRMVMRHALSIAGTDTYQVRYDH